MRNHFRRQCALLLQVIVCCLISCSRTAGADTLSVVDQIRARDAKLSGSGSLVPRLVRTTMKHPSTFTRPQQGMVTYDCSIAWTNEKKTLRCKGTFDAPQYCPPGTSGYRDMDFDEKGNMLVWRTTEITAARTATQNTEVRKNELHCVAPTGQVIEITSGVEVRHYPIKSKDSDVLFDAFSKAMLGRLGDQLEDSPASIAFARDEESLLEVPGHLGDRTQSGLWFLRLDEEESGFIRYARFESDPGVPLITITNDGTVTKNDFRVARSGSVNYGALFRDGSHYVVSFEAVEIGTAEAAEEQILSDLQFVNQPRSEKEAYVTDLRESVPR